MNKLAPTPVHERGWPLLAQGPRVAGPCLTCYQLGPCPLARTPAHPHARTPGTTGSGPFGPLHKMVAIITGQLPPSSGSGGTPESLIGFHGRTGPISTTNPNLCVQNQSTDVGAPMYVHTLHSFDAESRRERACTLNNLELGCGMGRLPA